MTQSMWDRLEEHYRGRDRYHGRGASEEAIHAASQQSDVPSPEGYREFLARYGCGKVGPLCVYGLGKPPAYPRYQIVVQVTRQYRRLRWEGLPYKGWPGTDRWAVVAIDHSGDPWGIAPDGRVWMSDHDGAGPLSEGGWWWIDENHYGTVEPVFESFEGFLDFCLEISGC